MEGGVRLEYYEARLFSRQNIQGAEKKFSNLQETIQITILGNKRFFNDNTLVHTFEYYDPVEGVSLDGKTRIITLELCKAWQSIEKPFEEMESPEAWAGFLEYLTNEEKREKINEILQKEAGIAMAAETLITITDEEREWWRQESIFRNELDAQNDRAHAREEKTLEIARNFKNAGVFPDLIAQATGLSPEEIDGL